MDGQVFDRDGNPPEIRVDPELGTREVVEFFGRGSSRMFGCRHEPAGDVIAGVVICSSVHAEFLRNYRREVLLARSLANADFAVQRFQYRGSGNSDGETEDVTFESMVGDAIAAADRLRETTSVDRVAFMGTRLGALVAAGAVARQNGAQLVLWEPVLDTHRYFREAFRAGRIHELKKGVQKEGSAESQIEEFRRTGRIDVLGYSIGLPLYESTRDRTLEAELDGRPRQILLVQVSRKSELRTEHAVLASGLAERGFGIDTRVLVAAVEPWWFVGGRSRNEERNLTGQLVTTTKDWLVSALEGSRTAR